MHGILNAEYNNYEKMESVLEKCGYHGNGMKQMFTKHTQKDSLLNFRKSREISASNIKPFLSYAQKTTWGGGTKCPPG